MRYKWWWALGVCLAFNVQAVDLVKWTKVGNIIPVGVNGSAYAPIVQLGGQQIRLFINWNSVDNNGLGDLWLRTGSWSALDSPTTVLHITDPRDQFIRTSAVVQGVSGRYYALLYTGDGYPTQGGYSPSWAESEDGYNWTWYGFVSPFGRNQSSAGNLIVDEGRSDDYRFMAWIDLSWAGLVMMHSVDGLSWTSDLVNVWPFPAEVPQFVTGAKTPFGYHLIGADTYPITKLRHIFSCTGLPPWHILEDKSELNNHSSAIKGTSLVYDSANNLLHALVQGVHWKFTAKAFPC